jgi:hypothetical protein
VEKVPAAKGGSFRVGARARMRAEPVLVAGRTCKRTEFRDGTAELRAYTTVTRSVFVRENVV